MSRVLAWSGPRARVSPRNARSYHTFASARWPCSLITTAMLLTCIVVYIGRDVVRIMVGRIDRRKGGRRVEGRKRARVKGELGEIREGRRKRVRKGGME